MHGGTGGAPEENSNTVGKAGGDGAPEGNTRAMKHGLRADPWNLYESFDDTDQHWIDTLLLGIEITSDSMSMTLGVTA
ncbi:hypothetical protein [Halalkalicoccus salilacus]|uniref:hypothetical protein n=1 Tax=Halalkalicoccus salilacus TaxID=3117459 RepID=UPI00300F6F79